MTEHYYSEKQTSKLRIKELNINLRGNKLKFYTGSGIFSIGEIDKGTYLLIDKCIIKDNWSVLDLGCGYGCVGIALANEVSSVLMTDINERAVKLSRMNIKINKLENIKVIKSDLYKNVKKKFDTIITNPPTLAGRKVCFDIIEGAKEHLNKGGLLQLVARHNKGGKILEAKMKEVFGNVKDIAKKSGYRVYISKSP